MSASAALLVGTGLLAALPVIRGGGPRHWRLGIAGAVTLCCAAAWSLPTEALTSPLVAQARGQGPLVIARAALAAGALVLVRLTPRRERRTLVAATAATLVLSWVLQLGLLALAGSYAVTALRARRMLGATRPLRTALVGAACVLGACWLALRPAPSPPPQTDRDIALYWEARGNPWRAMPAALAWAEREPTSVEAAALLDRLEPRVAGRAGSP